MEGYMEALMLVIMTSLAAVLVVGCVGGCILILSHVLDEI